MGLESNTNPTPGVADEAISLNDAVESVFEDGYADTDDEEDKPSKPQPEEDQGDEPVNEEAEGDEEEEVEQEEEEELEDSTEDEDEQEDDADEEEVEVHSLLVNGQEHKVTLDEMKTLAQQGMDYTQKTKALAEDRKRVTETQSEWSERISGVVEELEVLQVGLSTPRYTQEQIDAAMAQDPAKAAQMKHEEEKRQTSLNYIRERIKTARSEQSEIEQNQVRELKVTAYHELVEAMPEFAFNATAGKPAEAATRLNSYLREMGYSQDDIDMVVDSRYLIVAEKARRYDELMGAKKPNKQPKPKPKVTKKKAHKPKVKPKNTAMDKLSKSNSLDDAVNVLLEDMTNKGD